MHRRPCTCMGFCTIGSGATRFTSRPVEFFECVRARLLLYVYLCIHTAGVVCVVYVETSERYSAQRSTGGYLYK